MKKLFTAVCLLSMFCFVASTGCDTASDTTAETADHDHDDHDHGDHEGHDHDDHEGHDHDDHEGHDHEGHDHDDHEGHDHGDHEGPDHGEHEFETLADAVTEIVSLRDTIREGVKAEKVDHGPLHGIGNVLGAAEELVKKMPEDNPQRKAALEAIETLFDSFGAVDQGLHGDGGKTYDEVSEAIDAAIKVLQTDGE
ncbi:MAG: hypothetical protein AAFU85_04900 [Planctomycetota bacterium]